MVKIYRRRDLGNNQKSIIMKILFKYPSRGRQARFIEGMNSIINNMQNEKDYHILVTADEDDGEMNCDYIKNYGFPNTTIIYGTSESKIHAINRDLNEFDYDWDILICMSDDMRIIFYGFDSAIKPYFSNIGLDILLHVPDQDAGSGLATMYIAGRPFYERFGFIYNPAYKSLFCDNEVHEIAVMLNKYVYVNFNGLIEHLNPAYGHFPKDELFIYQQEIGWSEDQRTYYDRKSKNFDLYTLTK